MRNPTISVNPLSSYNERIIPREVLKRSMANKRIYHEMRKNIHLTTLQRSIIIGTVLGDGSLIETFSKNNLRLQIEHCIAQKEYVFWKYEMLKDLILTPPTYIETNRSWRFRTISHPEITQIGRLFYQDRRKIIPKILDKILTPIGLAVWFMDDGTRYHRNGTYTINTQCFTKKEQVNLMKILRLKFDISATSLHRDKSKWRLYIQKEASERFKEIIKPFISPSMAYKIGEPRRDYTLAPDDCQMATAG